MTNCFDTADEIVAKSASYVQALEDKSDWNSYLGSGVLGITMPPSLGGQGLPISSLIATFEGLGYGGGDAGILFAMAAQLWSVQYPILRFGTEEQKRAFIRPMIRGELRAAHAATEPEAGSDIFHLQTTALRCPGGYRLSGTKRYITNAPVADIALVLASTDIERKAWGISAFIVKLNTAGISRSSNIPKMGLGSAQFGEIRFEDCFVTEEQRLGLEGHGIAIFSSSLDLERAFIMAPAVGLMRRELELSVAHANTRRQRDRTIGSFQSVSNRIADMALRLELSRLLIYRAAALRDSGQSTKHYSPLVKLALSEFCVASSLDAMRNKGAAGYLLNDPSSINFRDAIGSLFYSGTSDILRNLIASHMGVDDV
ncbi:MAG TPA: acyl-CoA dehydrogenase family protein [Blastocatellia bacterium]|nr:acyl-CoA dehydrogenase family protein [Blastocatellia bacterium]